MPVDKFRRMSDIKTKDTGVSLTYINNNYIRSDGNSRITGNLDMGGSTIENLGEPRKPKDAVTKEYVDIGVGGSPFLKENDHYKATHTINMGFNKLLNLHKPIEPFDAATKDYVDYIEEKVKESLSKRIKQLITVNARYCGEFILDDYPFNFGGGDYKPCDEKMMEAFKELKGSMNGFLVPHSVLKNLF